MHIKQVIPGVYMLGGICGTGFLGANIYILINEDITIVDTGYPGREKQILNAVLYLGYTPSDVARIVLTHYHPDHIGSLPQLSKATGATVIAHKLDAPHIEGRQQQQFDRDNVILNMLLSAMDKFWPVFPVAVTSIVDDGDELPGGMIVRHLPGHTPGSLSLFMPEKNLIIVGDLLSNTFGLSLPSRMFTVHRDEELRSLKKLEDMEFDIICFGHGRPVTYHAHDVVSCFVKKINAG
jgi:glyoxylase-like metal-dependent hydrolase (beta-lactamase superfamily II)